MIAGTQLCRQCGAALNPSEVRGLCPACLLETSLGTEAEEELSSSAGDARLEQTQLAEATHGGQKTHRLGDYELLGEIGRGGMGVIYRARQVSLDRIVAVKTILTGPLASPDFAQRFQTEARAAANLRHPNIVTIHEIGVQEGRPYFSMDFVEGQSLARLISRSPLPPLKAAEYLRAVARAVHYAHQQGILHRDLKPSNVLIEQATDAPRVTDFGLARRLEGGSDLTVSGQVVGTASYMPPEQAAGKPRQLGPWTDVYALGATLYQALTGRPPHQAASTVATLKLVLEAEPATPRALNPGLPLDLETICLKCLEKDPEKRYGTAAELADELDRFLKGEPILARPIGPTGKLWRWCQRKPVLAAMTGAVLTLLLTVTLVSLTAARRIAAEGHRAEQNARDLRLNLYVADMNLARQAILNDNLGLARQIISRYIPKAQGTAKQGAGFHQDDLRAWEWRYLWWLCRGDSHLALRGHSNSVSCAVYSPDGRTLVTASFDQTVRVWDSATKRTLRVLTGFAEPLQRNAVAFSPDGKVLAVADGKDIHIFETVTWNKTRTVPNQALPGYIFSLPIAFSPDGKTLSCNAETGIRHWDTTSWERLADRPQNTAGEFGRLLTYSPDGRRFATARDNEIVVWDTVSCVQHFTGRLRWPTSMAFSPNGALMVAVGQDDHAIVWDVDKGNEIVRLPTGSVLVVAAAFSPDGRRLVTGGSDQLIRVWEMEQGKLRATLKGAQGEIHALGFSPDGWTLVSGGTDGTARLWSTTPGTAADGVLTVGDPLCFSVDGKVLVVLGTNSTVEYWDVQSRRTVAAFKIPTRVGPRDRIVAAPNGTLVTHICSDGIVRLWNPGTGKQIAELSLDPPPRLPLAAFSPDGHLLAVGCQTRARGGGGWTLVWDFRTGERRALPGADVYQPLFSPDGKILATGFGSDVRLWSVPRLKPVATLKRHSWTINGLAFSPDGRLLTSIGRYGDIRLWDTASGELKRLFSTKSSGNGLEPLAFSADSRTLASGGGGPPELWNVASGRVVLPLGSKPRYTKAPMFSPDGNTLVIGGGQGLPSLQQVELMQAPSLDQIDATELAEQRLP